MMIGTVFVQRTKSMHIDCNRTVPDDYAALAGRRLRERVRSALGAWRAWACTAQAVEV
jgi:hypothetical protein